MPTAVVVDLIERVSKLEARVEVLVKLAYMTMGAAVVNLFAVFMQ